MYRISSSRTFLRNDWNRVEKDLQKIERLIKQSDVKSNLMGAIDTLEDSIETVNLNNSAPHRPISVNKINDITQEFLNSSRFSFTNTFIKRSVDGKQQLLDQLKIIRTRRKMAMQRGVQPNTKKDKLVKRLIEREINILTLINSNLNIIGTVGWGDTCSIKIKRKDSYLPRGVSQLDAIIIEEGDEKKILRLSSSISGFNPYRMQDKIEDKKGDNNQELKRIRAQFKKEDKDKITKENILYNIQKIAAKKESVLNNLIQKKEKENQKVDRELELIDEIKPSQSKDESRHRSPVDIVDIERNPGKFLPIRENIRPERGDPIKRDSLERKEKDIFGELDSDSDVSDYEITHDNIEYYKTHTRDKQKELSKRKRWNIFKFL